MVTPSYACPISRIIHRLSNFIIEMEGEERTKGPNFVKLELQVIPKMKIRGRP